MNQTRSFVDPLCLFLENRSRNQNSHWRQLVARNPPVAGCKAWLTPLTPIRRSAFTLVPVQGLDRAHLSSKAFLLPAQAVGELPRPRRKGGLGLLALRLCPCHVPVSSAGEQGRP